MLYYKRTISLKELVLTRQVHQKSVLVVTTGNFR